MPLDSPALGGHTFQNPPNNMEISWEVIQQLNELGDGGVRQRILGYRLKASLSWDESWIRSQDLTGIMAVANDATGAAGTGLGALTFTPRPQSFPARTFNMLWTNKLDFKFHRGDFGTYGGSIELIMPTLTATATDFG